MISERPQPVQTYTEVSGRIPKPMKINLSHSYLYTCILSYSYINTFETGQIYQQDGAKKDPPKDPLWVTQKVGLPAPGAPVKHAQHFIKTTFAQLLHFLFPFPWVTSCYAVWKVLLLGKAFASRTRQELSPLCCTIWFSGSTFHLAPEMERSRASRDQASSGPRQQDLQQRETSLTHAATSDAAILLSGLEETSLHRTIRPFRDSVDFSTWGVSE